MRLPVARQDSAAPEFTCVEKSLVSVVWESMKKHYE